VAIDVAAGRERSDVKELTLVTAAYAILTIVMALPFSLSPGSRVLADVPDGHMYLWTLAWDAHAFLNQPWRIFDANIYYPYANTLAYSENLIGSAFFAAPIIWLTGNIVLATNLTALLSCVLCGVGAFVLGRRLHLSLGGAFICGLIFAFAPPRFIRIGQLHMTAVQWIPFSLAFLHGYFESGRRRDLLLAVGFFSLQALSSGHGAAYLFLATAAVLTWQFASGTPLALRQRLSDFGVAGAYLIAPAVWVMLPYRISQAEAGLRRGYLSDALPTLESFLASPARAHQYLLAKFWGPLAQEPDAFLFPGVLVLVLAAIGVASWSPFAKATGDEPRRNRYVAFYLFLGILATMMFVAWPFELWRHVYWLPGLNFIRIPSRFIIMTVLALAVLAGFGVDRLLGRLPKKASAAAAFTIGALLIVEYTPYPFAGVPFAINVPAIDRWLDTQPKPFVVAELPSPNPGNAGALVRHQTRSMFHATAHWQKTIHGYSSLQRPLHDELYKTMAAFPEAESLAGLRETGVTHLVIHQDEYGSQWPAIEARLARMPELELIHVEADGRVYALLPP
jgi:hypothetical protein